MVAMKESESFLAVLLERRPEEPTACPGWRVRDLVAHLAAGAREEADLIEDALAGSRSRPTREFAERESAYRALEYTDLLSALAGEAGRLDAAIDALERAGGRVEFTGAVLDAAGFRLHTRSELVLHRWDMAGDDERGRGLLEQPELTRHAVKVLSTMDGLQESFRLRAARTDTTPDFVLRSPDQPDVVVRTGPGAAVRFPPAVDPGLPVVRCAASDRLLLLWGRATDRADLSDVPERYARSIRKFLCV